MALSRTLLLAGTILAGLAATPEAAVAQTSPAPFLSAARYDALRRVTGTISPDPDGAGPLLYRAVRNTYDAAGRLTLMERGTLSAWQAESVAPASWSGFTVLQTVASTYDAMGRKLSDLASSGGVAESLTQTSYDAMGRARCTVTRMNPAAFASPPADACTPGPTGSFGPDRITRNSYDAAGRLARMETGVGTAERRDQALYSYTPNGQLASLEDGDGNRSEPRYDGHDRLTRLVYPSPTAAGVVNEADYENYTLDAAGNVTIRRLRDNQSITDTYDALNRLIARDLPATAWYNLDRSYAYDNLGRMTQADGNGLITRSYDALGRMTSETTPWGTTGYQYDAAGRRSRLSYPAGGPTIGYSYTDTGEMTEIREDPAGTNVLLATYGYDDLGRRTTLTRGNGTVTTWAYGGTSRVYLLGQNFAGTADDLLVNLAYNPAGQVTSLTRSNDAYAYAPATQNRTDTHNGLNQIASMGGITVGHDARGNTNSIGATSYGYTARNRLATVSDGVTYREMIDDSLDRLHRFYDGSANRWLLYDGENLIAESEPNVGLIARRYVHGPGQDEPLVWYEGGTRRWLHADERGSIIAISDDSGNVTNVNRYDEYGVPQGTLTGRFGYTGQAWLPELGLYYYRARMYEPTLGRFMQTDPVGYEASPNLYGYVDGDPINAADPSGNFSESLDDHMCRASDFCSNSGELRSSHEPLTFVQPGSGESGGGSSLLSRLGDQASAISELISDSVSYSGDMIDYAGRTALSSVSLGLVERPSLPLAPAYGVTCGCLEGGTLVATPNGLRPIESIAVGDLVIARNDRTGAEAPQRVIALVRPAPKPLYAVTLRQSPSATETINATEDHPWKVIGRGWVETRDLAPGDRVQTASGRPGIVQIVTATGHAAQAYNLTVENWHTFLVGQNRFVVHNRDCVRFADLRRHAEDHAAGLGIRSVAAYRDSAIANLQARGFAFRHEREARVAHITRTQGGFIFTSANPSGTRIFTHMFVAGRRAVTYFPNIGITLPRGF